MTLTFVCVNVVRYMKRAQEFVIVCTTKGGVLPCESVTGILKDSCKDTKISPTLLL